MQTGEDANTVLNYLDVSGFGDEKSACAESRNSLENYELDYVLENIDLRQHLIRLLCYLHFHDVQATHVAPLKSEEFIIPCAVDYRTNFTRFLQNFNDMY
jgi:hypothetical protein